MGPCVPSDFGKVSSAGVGVSAFAIMGAFRKITSELESAYLAVSIPKSMRVNPTKPSFVKDNSTTKDLFYKIPEIVSDSSSAPLQDGTNFFVGGSLVKPVYGLEMFTARAECSPTDSIEPKTIFRTNVEVEAKSDIDHLQLTIQLPNFPNFRQNVVEVGGRKVKDALVQTIPPKSFPPKKNPLRAKSRFSAEIVTEASVVEEGPPVLFRASRFICEYPPVILNISATKRAKSSAFPIKARLAREDGTPLNVLADGSQLYSQSLAIQPMARFNPVSQETI